MHQEAWEYLDLPRGASASWMLSVPSMASSQHGGWDRWHSRSSRQKDDHKKIRKERNSSLTWGAVPCLRRRCFVASLMPTSIRRLCVYSFVSSLPPSLPHNNPRLNGCDIHCYTER